MLSQLFIKNVAVIESASIDFENGFNVFTGETGAGKSILIDSINAVLGGRLLQNIAGHRAPVRGEPAFHTVHAVEGSILFDLYDRDFKVNTYHHQAVLTLGNGLTVTARAQDGTVEGFEHSRLPLFGVQWHPERILNGEEETAHGLPLFRYFLCLCREGEGYLYPPVQKNPDVRFACGIIGEE